MAYYRNSRRTYRKKRTYRKRYTRRYRKKGMGSTGKRFFKCKLVVGSISSNAGGIISSGASNNPSSSGDWGSIAALFDSYRVCAMKVKFIPQLPNDTSAQTGYFPLYVTYDPDNGTNILGSADDAVQYENCKIVSVNRPWTYYAKCPRVSMSTTSVSILQGGYIDSQSPLTSQGIWFYGTGFDASQAYGTLIVTWYVVARDRK